MPNGNEPPPDEPRAGLLMVAYNLTVTGPNIRAEREVEVDSRLFAPRELDLKGDVFIDHEALGVPVEPLRLRLDDEEARARRERNGRELVDEARRACTADSDRPLRTLIALFPSIVLRLRAVQDHLDALPPERAEILVGTRRGRGRPPEPQMHLARVRGLERLVATYQLTQDKAAERLTATGVHPSKGRLKNLTSPKADYPRYLRFLVEGVLVREDVLEPLAWGTPPTTMATVYEAELEGKDDE